MDLKEQLQKWHNDNEHRKIIEAIEAIPRRERDFELTSLLGRALNNDGRHNDALAVLRSVEDEGRNDCLWNFRIGYSYFYRPHSVKNVVSDYETAHYHFTEALRLGDTDEDTLELIRYCEFVLQNLSANPEAVYEYADERLSTKCLK
ncbi:MAG: hypothetical protein K2O14_11000 [Oscillospiraceae bacterium]|nr:hypothetical protein [Oscillospiraceae bacterium]